MMGAVVAVARLGRWRGLFVAAALTSLASGCGGRMNTPADGGGGVDDGAVASGGATGRGGSGGATGGGGSGGAAGTGGNGGAAGTGGSGGAGAIDGGNPDAAPDAPKLEIAWGACPDGFVSQCASVKVPLDWNAAGGPSIAVFLSRSPARVRAAGQLWLLQGGPGGSGEAFVDLVMFLGPLLPDLDIYVLEHRGVGESARLGCPTQEDPTSVSGRAVDPTEAAACIDALENTWGDRLAQFTVTQAASDLAHLVDATRGTGQKLFVYGVSYGTTWAMRFMQLRPAAATGVVLDSVVAPGTLFLSRFDLGFDPVAQKLAAACAVDPICRGKLGADPWARITDLFTALDNGACPALGLDRRTWSAVASLLIEVYDLRTLVFPLSYRVARCSPADVTVVSRFFTALFSGEDRGPDRGSWALGNNIALSELWEMPPPDAAEIARREIGAFFWPGELDAGAALFDLWPRYPLDEFANRWPVSTVPLLAMNGTFDPQTPVESARLAATAFTAPHQSFVEFPGAPHGVIFTTPVTDATQPPCGLQAMLAFLTDPTAPPSLACQSRIKPLAFSWDPQLLAALFGTTDAWENPIGPAAGPSPDEAAAAPEHPDWDAVIAEARRRRPL
jgi:pimeloyl-ACP methyl ester carboxylesterase